MGERIKQYRKSKGLTAKAFAQTLGIDPTYLSKLENGRRNLTDRLSHRMFPDFGTYTCSTCSGIHRGIYDDFLNGRCFSGK